ncbi:hypothetical protein M514_07676 [Trichuris suis]|uniref:Uncharacterized protein n=1 Tax=Trichuris suis TaxID=68888 RepID=A0A085MXH9_9BILA|nr:hypothetical protein M513_07676 [Trichuris suis]KFD61925.1 hypothetical protein M514_07676 [Trichuris suis]
MSWWVLNFSRLESGRSCDQLILSVETLLCIDRVHGIGSICRPMSHPAFMDSSFVATFKLGGAVTEMQGVNRILAVEPPQTYSGDTYGAKASTTKALNFSVTSLSAILLRPSLGLSQDMRKVKPFGKAKLFVFVADCPIKQIDSYFKMWWQIFIFNAATTRAPAFRLESVAIYLALRYHLKTSAFSVAGDDPAARMD